MVPITIVAFILAMLVVDGFSKEYPANKLDIFDIIGLIFVCVGVFIYNFFEIKPQKVSIAYN